MTSDKRNYLTIDDVARIFGECRAEQQGGEAKPYTRGTVRDMVTHSAGTRTTPSRYGTNPMPLPDKGVTQLIWSPRAGQTIDDLERELRAWFNSRPGSGAGGGPKPKQGGKANRRTTRKGRTS